MSKALKSFELAADVATEHFGIRVSLNHLLSRSRNKEYRIARQVAMYFIRSNYMMSLKEIGRVANKDHSTVIHACVVVNDMIACNDFDYCEIYENMVKNIGSIESEKEQKYLAIFPKYADHEKLIQQIFKRYNIQIFKYERSIFTPSTEERVLLHDTGHGEPITDGEVSSSGQERELKGGTVVQSLSGEVPGSLGERGNKVEEVRGYLQTHYLTLAEHEKLIRKYL
jgi:hypothetical protein